MTEQSSQPSVRRPLRRSLAAKIAAGLLAILAVVYGAISIYAAQTLTTPRRVFDPGKAGVFAVIPEEVTFHADDGLTIAGWFVPSADSDKALILVPGRNASRTREFEDEFAEFGAAMHGKGFSVLMIDLRGHGQSAPARFTFGLAERRDVIAAVDWLKQRGYPPQKVGVLGVSMGAAAVVGAAAEDPDVGVLVLDSAFADVYPVIQGQWRTASGLPDIFLPSTMRVARWLTGYDLTSSRPVDELARMASRPILIIHSAADSYVPVEQARRMHAAATASEYWETGEAKHSRNYNTYPQEYVEKVTDFLNRSLQ